MEERELREQIADCGKSLFARRYTSGSSGNISIRLPDGFLITPTNSSLGDLDPERISKVDLELNHIAGDRPSKEASLHLAMYRGRLLFLVYKISIPTTCYHRSLPTM